VKNSLTIRTAAVKKCLAPLLFASLLAGCAAAGPGTLVKDRFDYNASISTSWREQLLLNMVRLRYGEAPVFLDVSSVIAQYERRGSVSLSASTNTVGGETLGAGGNAVWLERPTLTYVPRRGKEFTRSLLAPVPPAVLLSFVQGGWPMDLTMKVAVRAIGGIPSIVAGEGRRAWNPEFFEILNAMADLGRLGALRLRVTMEEGRRQAFLKVRDIEREEVDDRALSLLREKLGLDPSLGEYRVVYGRYGDNPAELAIFTISLLDIMTQFSWHFDVPAEHVEQGWTLPAMEPPPARPPASPRTPLRVRSGSEPPGDAFVAIRNRGAWFWIDESDLKSKRIFSFLMVLLSLSESREEGAGPIVTVGAGS